MVEVGRVKCVIAYGSTTRSYQIHDTFVAALCVCPRREARHATFCTYPLCVYVQDEQRAGRLEATLSKLGSVMGKLVLAARV